MKVDDFVSSGHFVGLSLNFFSLIIEIIKMLVASMKKPPPLLTFVGFLWQLLTKTPNVWERA